MQFLCQISKLEQELTNQQKALDGFQRGLLCWQASTVPMDANLKANLAQIDPETALLSMLDAVRAPLASVLGQHEELSASARKIEDQDLIIQNLKVRVGQLEDMAILREEDHKQSTDALTRELTARAGKSHKHYQGCKFWT